MPQMAVTRPQPRTRPPNPNPNPDPKSDPKPDPNPRCGRALHAECMEKWLLRRNDCVFCQAT